MIQWFTPEVANSTVTDTSPRVFDRLKYRWLFWVNQASGRPIHFYAKLSPAGP
jgi:hypothetical protein